MKDRIIFKVISILFILCIAFFAFSCSQSNNANNNSGDNNLGNAVDNGDNIPDDPNAPEEVVRMLSEAPEKDYGGDKFRILAKLSDTVDHHWDAKDIYAEEENGDIINDAVYKRNTFICEKYNIQIVKTENETPTNLASKAVKAGSDEYDVMFAGLGDTVGVAQSGYLINLKSVPYIDLPKPWYDQNANSQLSVGGKLYMTFCDFTILDKDATWVYLFNKKLIQDLGLEDPYKLVNDGKWTIDKLTEMSKTAAKDLDGDGVMTWKDQFGWQGESGNMYMGIVACGVEMVVKNNEDIPEYVGLGERGMTAFTKLLVLFGDKNISLRVDDVTGFTGNIWTDVMDASFMEGRILFVNAGMNRVTLFRSMDTDFGIIPSPKLDEAQPQYYSSLTRWSATPLTVLATTPDLEKVGIIMDALCAESLYTLIPAYYDITLKTKFARDNESAEMLDLIFSTRRFDLGQIYGWGELNTIFANAMTKNSPDITSAIEKAESKVMSAIDKTVNAYDSNEN